MKILLVHQYYMRDFNTSGSARWNEMTRVWAEAGHDVTVIASMYSTSLAGKYPEYKGKMFACDQIAENLRVIRVHTSEKYNKNFFWRAWAYFTYMFFSFLAVLFYAKGKKDVVIATSPPLNVGPLGVVVAWLKRASFVFEVRDLWPESAIDTGAIKNPVMIRLMYWMEAFSYKHSKAINALTPAFVEKLKAKGIAAEKLWMVPNAADLDVIKPGPKDNDIRKKHNWGDKFVCLYTGAHGKANHLWQLIDVARKLEGTGSPIQIACVGNGMMKDALVETVEKENLTHIEFLPPVPKNVIGQYFNASDISIIVLKKVDTFKTVYPNKMFDSMSSQKPIVLAIDGVARKLVVDDAKCGLFAEPENADSLLEGIETYQNDRDLLETHGRNGHEYVVEHFDRTKLAKKYIDHIEELKK